LQIPISGCIGLRRSTELLPDLSGGWDRVKVGVGVSDPKQQDLDSVEHVSLWLRERSNDSAPIPLGRVRDKQDGPAQRNSDETVVQLRPVEGREQRAARQADVFAVAVAKAMQEELEPQFVEAPSILQKRRTFSIAARIAAAAGVAALAALVLVLAFPAPQGTEEDVSSALPTWQSLKSSLFPAQQPKHTPTLVVRNGSGLVNETLPLGVNVNFATPGVTITIDRIPTGASLTVGKPMGISEWRVPAKEISEASIVPPPDFVGTMNLTAELRGSDGAALVRGVVRLTWTPAKSGDAAGMSISATTAPTAPAPQPAIAPIPQPAAVPMPQPAVAPLPQQTAVAAPVPPPQQPVVVSTAPPDTARVEPPVRDISPAEVAGFIKRAQELLATGDLQAARLLLLRAAEARDARAALSLAKTYDPSLTKQFVGADQGADLAQARNWYQKAQEWGSPEAKQQLEALVSGTR
jgi:hypothetical protein